jgi:hypothetical protein
MYYHEVFSGDQQCQCGPDVRHFRDISPNQPLMMEMRTVSEKNEHQIHIDTAEHLRRHHYILSL